MNKFNVAEKFWFALCRNAAGGEGGGAGDVAAGSAPAEGAAPVLAGAEAAPAIAADVPASTFLNGAPLVPAEDAPAEDEAASADTPPVPAFDVGALTIPEGFALPEELGKIFGDVLNDDKLSPQERGQQLLDMYIKNTGETQVAQVAAAEAAAKETWKTMNNEWRDQIKSLPEFKADPDGEAGKVLQALTTIGAGPEFFAALDLTGAGNHPAILQVLHRLAKPLFEGSAVGGVSKPASTRRLGDAIYTSATKG